MKKKPPIRRWLDVSLDYPDEDCSAYASIVSFDNVVEGCEENRDPRFLYISAAAIREALDKGVTKGDAIDAIEKLLEGE